MKEFSEVQNIEVGGIKEGKLEKKNKKSNERKYAKDLVRVIIFCFHFFYFVFVLMLVFK